MSAGSIGSHAVVGPFYVKEEDDGEDNSMSLVRRSLNRKARFRGLFWIMWPGN